MNPQFIKYEVNATPESKRGQYDPLGVATIGIFNNQVLIRYTIKSGKEGKGFYISEFSQKLNGNWFKSHTIDSNVMKEEIESLIRRNLNQNSYTEETFTPAKAPTPPSQMSFTEECPF